MNIRSAFGYDRAAVSKATSLRSDKPSLTQQSQKDDADINVIVKRFGLGGVMPQGIRVPRYEDFGDVVFDFRQAQDGLIEAKRTFMTMPAEMRKRFGNDPVAFLEFVTDEKNADEMVKMGLASRPEKPVETVQKVEVVQIVDGKPVAVRGEVK